MAQPYYQPPPPPLECYRHRGQTTYIRCQRCSRPICPACMTEAAVGFQCPDCVAEGRRTTRQNRNPLGGLRTGNPAATSIFLIGVNVAVWLAIILTGNYLSPLYRWFGLTSLGTCVLTDDPGMFYPGATAALCASESGTTWDPGVADGAFWQVLTSVFTHVEILHLACNMLCLWFLGPTLERAVGRVRFVVLYLLSGLTGSATVLWLTSPTASTVGASGAVFGLMGALLVLAFKVRGDVRTVLIWLGINLAFTFTSSGISWQGHLGGLIGGAAIAAIIAYAPRENRERWQWAGFGAIALVTVVAIVARALMLA